MGCSSARFTRRSRPRSNTRSPRWRRSCTGRWRSGRAGRNGIAGPSPWPGRRTTPTTRLFCLTVEEGAALTVQPVRIFGDPVLRTPAEPVVDFDKDLRRLVDDLLDTMKEQNG